MPTIRTKDGIFLEIPEGMAPDAPEVREAVAAERAGRRSRRMASPEFQQKVEKQKAEDRETYDPTKGMSALDKVRANIGAGMANIGQGVRQIGSKFGLADEVPEEEVQEKRALDAQLARGTDLGVGADWMPTAGKALQFAGEVAPTVAVPGGAFARGASMLPKALTATAGRTAATTGALAGGASGALMPVAGDESRTLNTMLGGAAGAALPAAVHGARAGWNRLTGRTGPRTEAGRMLGVTPESPLPPDPATLGTPGAENVRLSTAATYDDPALASLELASRAKGRSPTDWSRFEKGQRGDVWENVQEGTRRAGTEGEHRLARAEDWRGNVEHAMRGAKPKVWEREVQQLRANLDQALRSPEGQNQMRPVLNEIIRQMDELGPEFTPQHLAQLRARMAGSVRGSPTDPFTSAPVSDPTFISLRKEFDNILNATTGGRWDKVLSGYKEGSVPVAQAKAETMARGKFMTPEGTPRVTASEGTPQVTEHALRQAIAVPEAKNVRGTAPTFAPESERVLKGTLQALERQNILQRTKGATTGGGGSMTAPLQEAMARMTKENVPAGHWVTAAIRWARTHGEEAALRELDQALIDPQRYYQIVQETIKAGQPPSPGMQAVVQALGAGAGGALPRSMQRQQEQRR